MSAREKYRRHCEDESSVPLFSQAWLLDALASEDWDAVLDYDSSGQVIGSMPFLTRKRWRMRVSTMPALVPRLGPWLRQGLPLTTKELSRQYHVLGNLAAGLPDTHYFAQNWNPEISSWLPFHWKGFAQTTFYTYRLDPTDPDRVWAAMASQARQNVRKAQRHDLQASFDEDLDEFLRINDLVFARQGMRRPYSNDDVRTFDRAMIANAARLIVLIRDPDGQTHAGCYVVWDEQCAYYLLGGADPELRASGAHYLALWEAIRYVAGKTEVFDFEGSMIEPIEVVFRKFGGHPVPYHSVSRVRGILPRATLLLRSQ